MLRQAEIERVLGRRMIQRLRKSGWIAPVSTENRVVYYAERDLHRALSRVQSQGYLLSGRVRSVFVSARSKVRKRSLEDTLADLELDNL
jgi:hypothetical protein